MNNNSWLKKGIISVITGCMFSGKTHELVRRLQVLSHAKKKIVVFKPDWKNYQNNSKITSRLENSFPAFAVKKASDVFEKIKKIEKISKIDVIAFDETQFLPLEIFPKIKKWVKEEKIIIFAGLDKDYFCEYNSLMSHVLVRADIVDKLSAICSLCHNIATRTQRLSNGKEINLYFPKIIPDGLTEYQARCHQCFVDVVTKNDHHSSKLNKRKDN